MERKQRPVRSRKTTRRPFRASNIPFWKKKYSVEDIAVTAYEGVKQIKRLINTEVKQLNTVVSNSPDNSTFNTTFVSSLVGVAQGDGYNERSGVSLRPQKIVLLGHFTKHSSATETVLRVLIVKDKQQAAGVVPSTSDVLDTSSGFSVNAAFQPITQQVNNTRFKILHDQRFVASTSYPTVALSIELPVSGHVTYYNTGATNIQSSGIYLIATSDQSLNTPTFAWTSAFYFTDD